MVYLLNHKKLYIKLAITNVKTVSTVGGECMSVIIDYDKCTGAECAECVNACPMEVFEIQGDKVVVAHEDECTFCMVCEDVCPTGAVKVKDD